MRGRPPSPLSPIRPRSAGRRAGRWLLAAVCALVGSGCAQEGERIAAWPVLDPRLPFPALRDEAAAAPAPVISLRQDSRDRPPRTFGEVTCGLDGGADRRGSAVPLGEGVLAAALPPGWVSAVEGRKTIFVHYRGSEPIAWFLAQEQGAPSGSLTAAFRDFQSWVDHRLVRALTLAPAAPPPEDAASSAALRLPDGYTSSRGSFTGWRWIGRCDNKSSLPSFQLGLSYGIWHHRDDDVPAYMVFGSVRLIIGPSADYRIHLAMVCESPCPREVEVALAQILGSIERSSAAVRDLFAAGSSSGWRFADLREAIGLPEPPQKAPAEPAPSGAEASAPVGDGGSPQGEGGSSPDPAADATAASGDAS